MGGGLQEMRPFDSWTHEMSPQRKSGLAILVERCDLVRTRHVAAVLMLAFIVAGCGNSGVAEWNMPGQSIPVEATTDFVENARQAASYTVNNLTPHHYRMGLPGELYSRFVSGGSPGTEVTVAYKHGFIEIDGTGLSAAQATRLLEVTAGRASRFAPTDTLYGAGQP